MGLLDGDLARSIYQGFRGKLISGIIRFEAAPDDVLLDTHGDPVSVTPVDVPIEGFTEAYSAFSKSQAGIPMTDLKVNIFAASMPGRRPAIKAKVRLDPKTGSRWYEIRNFDTDPATALWVCQSFEIGAPA